MINRPAIDIAIVMEREAAPNQWEAWRHRPVELLAHDSAFGDEARVLRDDGRIARTLHPGFRLELFRDECEGYHLNLTSGAPSWFVLWRSDDEDPSRAWPHALSVSYNECGRWLDAQEHVDNLPLPVEIVQWLQAFNDEHYRPEPKRRRRPASFVSPAERGS